MECAIQYLGLQVSNWVFTPESRDQGQNQVFGLCEGLIFALEVECLTAVTSVRKQGTMAPFMPERPSSLDSFGSWPADPSWVRPVGMTLVWGWRKDWLLLTVLLFNTLHASEIQLSPEITLAAFILPPLSCAEVMQGSYSHARAHTLSDMLFILYYMCEWWNSSFIFTSSCVFLSPSYIPLVFKPPEKTFPSFNANFWSRCRLFFF